MKKRILLKLFLATFIFVLTAFTMLHIIHSKEIEQRLTNHLKKVSASFTSYQMEVLDHYKKHLQELILLFDEYKFSEIESVKAVIERYFVDTGLRHYETKYILLFDKEGSPIINIENNKLSQSDENVVYNSTFRNLLTNENKIIVPTNISPNNLVFNYISPIYQNNQRVGTVIIGYSYAQLSNLFDNLILKGELDNIFVTDNKLSLLYSNDPSAILEHLSAQNNVLPEKFNNDGFFKYKDNFVIIKSLPEYNIKFGVSSFNKGMINLLGISKINLIVLSTLIFLLIISFIYAAIKIE